MSQAIGHFAVGVSGGVLLLMFYPKIIPKPIKNDLFFIFLSGLWALIPDFHLILNDSTSWLYTLFYQSSGQATFLSNIFWFHGLVDNIDIHDTTLFSTMLIIIAMIPLYFYYKKINKKSS